MVYPVRGLRLAAAFAGLLLATACNDPGSPASPEPNAQLAPADGGMLAVDVTTTGSPTAAGSDIDPDGYTVWVDFSQSQAIGSTGLVTFTGLAAGDHPVALYGIASNCTVYTLDKGSNNPRTVSLVEGLVGTTDFDVGCGPWGGLFISTNTTGVDLDTDGYTITVDGETSQAIATNGNITLTLLYEGNHSVALSGVAGNCTLSGSNPRTVTISPGETASLAFSASCVPTGSGTGSLTVTTSTTGSDVDPDGYIVTIDGTSSQAIGVADTVTFTGSAGDHPVALSGLASNCTVSGENPRTVAVAADGAATTSFDITCAVPQARVVGQGQIGLGAPTPYNNVQTIAFDLRADLTGRFTFTDWSNIHPSGNPASLTTDPSTDPETSVTAYRDSSVVCSDPSRGVEFDALGREDEGAVVSYTVILCDEGPEGSGTDFFSFFIPVENYGRSGIVTSGDIAKR